MPNEDEMAEGIRNLKANEWKVDFVITHCAPSSTSALLSHGSYKADAITEYLENIKARVDYKRWYFGHYHRDMAVNAMDIAIYKDIIRIY